MVHMALCQQIDLQHSVFKFQHGLCYSLAMTIIARNYFVVASTGHQTRVTGICTFRLFCAWLAVKSGQQLKINSAGDIGAGQTLCHQHMLLTEQFCSVPIKSIAGLKLLLSVQSHQARNNLHLSYAYDPQGCVRC